MNLLAATKDVTDIFGTVEPPKGMDIGGGAGADPVSGLGSLVGFGINLFVIVAGMFLLIYLLWGAFDWISSSGEKEKITKAQNKITNALIGFVLIFVVLAVFSVLGGQILKIVNKTDGGFELRLPKMK